MMEIVIKIPDKVYKFVQNTSFVENENILFKQTSNERQQTLFLFNILDAIKNGTPLPEHHGNLIDVNVLKNNIHYVPLAPIFQGDYVTYRNVIFADILDMLPTIIEGSDSE